MSAVNVRAVTASGAGRAVVTALVVNQPTLAAAQALVNSMRGNWSVAVRSGVSADLC